MTQKWPKINKSYDKSLGYFSDLQELVTIIRNLKAENKIAATEFPNCYLESKILSKKDLEIVAKLSRVNIVEEPLKINKFKTKYSKGEIDLIKELSQKEKDKLKKYKESLENKLKNKDFIKNAPPRIVKEIKDKLRVIKKTA